MTYPEPVDNNHEIYACLFCVAFLILFGLYHIGYHYGKNDLLIEQGIQRQEAVDKAAEAAANSNE